MKQFLKPEWLGVALSLLVFCGIPCRGAEGGKAVDDYNFAAWLYNTGKYSLAVDAYESFLKEFPDHEKQTDARFGLAQSRFHLDAFKEAAAQYEAIRKETPGFPQIAEVLFQLGQSRVALEQFDRAENCFAEVADKHKDHYLGDWAIARRAACLTSLGKNEAAEALLLPFLKKYTSEKKASADLPATREMLKKLDAAGVKAAGAFLSLIERSTFTLALAQFNLDHFEDAAASFRGFLALYPDSELATEARFRLAQSLYQKADYDGAARAYSEVDRKNPEFAAVSAFEEGLSLYKAGKLKDASAAFAEMAATFASDDRAPKASLYAGTFLYESGDFDGAIAKLQPLVGSENPFADEAAYWVGMSLFRLKRLGESRDAFLASLKAYPSSSLAGDMRLGLADVHLAADNLAAAADVFEAYVKGSPRAEKAPRALYSAAVALHRADLFDRSDAVCGSFLDNYGKDELRPDVLFLSGENRFLADNHDGASARYQEFLGIKDADPGRVARAYFRMAWVHHGAGRFKDALKAIDDIEKDAAGAVIKAESDYLAGLCHFEQDAYGKAIKAFLSYLDADDHSRFGDDATLKVAIAWQKEGELKKSIQSLRGFKKEYPESELLSHALFLLAERYSEEKNYREALKLYREVADRKDAGDLAPYALFGLGIACYDQGQWDEAAAAFARLVDECPDSELVPQAHYRRGRAMMNALSWEVAAGAFASLLKASPKHELARSAQVNAAACYQELKQWDNAAQAHAAAISNYKPGEDQARLYYELAWAHREAGRPDDALKAFRELADGYPKDPLAADAFFHLAEAAYKVHADSEEKDRDAKKLDEARELYENVLAMPDVSRLLDKTLYRIGWCHWQQEQYKESAAAFDRLIDESPKSDLVPDALFQSGLAHSRLDDTKRAQERMQQLIEEPAHAKFPYRADALMVLSDCRVTSGDSEAALESLATYFSKHADHHDVARAQLLKGKALYALKRYDEAVAALEESTRLTRSAVAAEARFYIGQAHQIQSKFKDAVVAYLRIQALYASEREWAAAAAFESAKCYEAMGQKDAADAALRDVVRQYKGTQWAKLAAERLD